MSPGVQRVRREESIWIVVAVILAVAAIFAGGEHELTRWARRYPPEATPHLPGPLAAIVGATVALRVGWLVRAREPGRWGACLALSALLEAWAGVFASAFVLLCALSGTLGFSWPEYQLPLDVAVNSLFSTAPLVLIELFVLVKRARSRSPTWTVHLIGPLAWFLGLVFLFYLGMGFFLT